jgi:hypothetical protein
MSVNKDFELYKLRREIKRSGIGCKFYRPVKNDYDELEQDFCVSLSDVQFFGLYHEVNSHVELKTDTMTQWRTVKVPAFLIPWEDVQSLELRTNDIAEINGKKFIITKVGNIQEWNLIADIYLEVQDIGL